MLRAIILGLILFSETRRSKPCNFIARIYYDFFSFNKKTNRTIFNRVPFLKPLHLTVQSCLVLLGCLYEENFGMDTWNKVLNGLIDLKVIFVPVSKSSVLQNPLYSNLNLLWNFHDKELRGELLITIQSFFKEFETPTLGKSEEIHKRRKFKLPDAIEAVLKEEGKPKHAKYIIKRVIEMGFETNINTVVATLVRYNNKNTRFIRTGKNIYKFVEDKIED